jgi:DNA helicase IV
MSQQIDLATELAALADAREAARAKLDRLTGMSAVGADEFTEAYIGAVVAATIDKLQNELTVFGRIDDEHPWRIGLFGIDRGGEQLVVDWRAHFAEGFYRATLNDPMGLVRRVSYVGCIDDLMIEDFATGEVAGTSPLMAELARSRGPEMRAAVATLQTEQDRLVRLDPTARLVLRGGPGTGKTVVGLHRAAWLVYNDRRVTSDRILVLGPSEKFLQFVATVLPTLGEARIVQTTFERHLGAPATAPGSDPRWVEILDRLEASLLNPREVRVRGRRMPEDDVAELIEQLTSRELPWRERRKVFIGRVVAFLEAPRAEVEREVKDVFPAVSAATAWRKVRSRATLEALGVDEDLIAAWRSVDDDGALRDEVKARFEGVPARYSHVIVDEAQDLTLFQLRAVQRRSDGLTLVGDDAQRSAPGSLGLRAVAARLDAPLEQMATAYRMSAEIADWLNAHAMRHGLDAVELLGVRPTGIEVSTAAGVDTAATEMRATWPHVAVIDASDVWSHKGVEYDAVVVDTRDMTPSEIYLSASRAAHQLIIVAA